MQFARKGNISSQILAILGVLLLAVFITFWVRMDNTPASDTPQYSEESAARAMEMLSQGKTTEVLLGAYSQALVELAQVAEGWTDESSAAMIQATEDTLLSLRVPAPLRAAHLQAVLQVQALSESDAIQEVAQSLRTVIERLQAESRRISTE